VSIFDLLYKSWNEKWGPILDDIDEPVARPIIPDFLKNEYVAYSGVNLLRGMHTSE